MLNIYLLKESWLKILLKKTSSIQTGFLCCSHFHQYFFPHYSLSLFLSSFIFWSCKSWIIVIYSRLKRKTFFNCLFFLPIPIFKNWLDISVHFRIIDWINKLRILFYHIEKHYLNHIIWNISLILTLKFYLSVGRLCFLKQIYQIKIWKDKAIVLPTYVGWFYLFVLFCLFWLSVNISFKKERIHLRYISSHLYYSLKDSRAGDDYLPTERKCILLYHIFLFVSNVNDKEKSCPVLCFFFSLSSDTKGQFHRAQNVLRHVKEPLIIKRTFWEKPIIIILKFCTFPFLDGIPDNCKLFT